MKSLTENDHSKCSKISNTFLFLFSYKMFGYNAGIHKMIVRIANREDHDQTASEEAVWSGSALFVLAFLTGNCVLNFSTLTINLHFYRLMVIDRPQYMLQNCRVQAGPWQKEEVTSPSRNIREKWQSDREKL